MEKPIDLRVRTKKYALRIITLYRHVPKSTEAQIIGKQILRSGTSIGAHYHEATRSRSRAEMISKLELCLQELEETIYWMELLVEADILGARRVTPLMNESRELVAIFTTSVRKAKANRKST